MVKVKLIVYYSAANKLTLVTHQLKFVIFINTYGYKINAL